MSVKSPFNRKLNDSKLDSSEKENMLSSLRAQIFELEQNEKNFTTLNQKFRTLQNE